MNKFKQSSAMADTIDDANPVRRRGRPRVKGPSEMDATIGVRLRIRRTLLGYSQEKLGRMLGVTFQQVQKYERGANRISASRLHKLSELLSVPISYFYDKGDPLHIEMYSATSMAENNDQTEYDDGTLTRREILELARAYNRIKDPAMRKRIFEMTKAVSNLNSPPPDDEPANTETTK